MNTWPIVELTIERHTFGGEVIGRLPDGRAVFVPFALPGEIVRARIVEEKKQYARAEIVEVLRPSAARIEPRCIHFGVCGGCHYQHLGYAEQLSLKAEILSQQLERIGKLKDIPVPTIIPSPSPWYYRNHVQFHLTPEGKLGYVRTGSKEVIPIQECHLAEPILDEIRTAIEIEPEAGINRIGLRVGRDEDIQVILEGGKGGLPLLSVEGLPLSVVHISPKGSTVLAGSAFIWMEVFGRRFRVSAGSFFQVNTRVAEEMVSYVLSKIPSLENQICMDLYCGVGLFSAFLASHCGRLIGIEESASACDDFAVNLDDYDHVELYCARVEEALPYINVRADFMLADPPRSGFSKQVLETILKIRPKMLVYVSCDPATLARDSRGLSAGGYHLSSISFFDVFPQTYSIESISIWAAD